VFDLDRVREIRGLAVFGIDSDEQAKSAAAGFREVRPQLEQIEGRGLPRCGMPPIELSEPAHLLQKFQQFNFGSHHSIGALLPQFTCHRVVRNVKDKFRCNDFFQSVAGEIPLGSFECF
jgi:hypothetical protein